MQKIMCEYLIVVKIFVWCVQRHGHKWRHYTKPPQPPNDMFVPIFDGSIKNMAIQTPNPLMERESLSISSEKGSNFHPTHKQHNGFNKSTKNGTWTFYQIYC